MKATYFHGLESKQGGPKVDFLKELFDDVYAPSLNYFENPQIFQDVLESSKDSALIVGSSMGGWLAYHVATHIGCDTVLFNPAVHSRPVNPFVEIGSRKNTNYVVLGARDDVIDPHESQYWLAKNGFGDFVIDWYDGGHRVPLEVFQHFIQMRVASATEERKV